MSKIIDDYIVGKEELSTREAEDLYKDMILPELNTINSHLNVIKERYLKAAARDILLATGSLVLGVWWNPALILSAGQTMRAFDSIIKAKDSESELKNHNLYFMWKLASNLNKH